MRPSRWCFLSLAALCAAAPVSLTAQVQAGATSSSAGMLAPTTTNAVAVSELRASMDRNNLWNFSAAAEHAKRAMEAEPTFGLARALAASQMAGPTARAEYARALSDASTASAGEALIALAYREADAGRMDNARRVARTAADLMPRDRQVAVWAALLLPDTQRVNALRGVASRFPDYAGARVWLAYYLTPAGLDSVVRANAADAMRVAMEAVSLAPNESGTHAAVAHVLAFTDRYAEAKQHLDAASKMTPVAEYVYQLRAQIAAVESNLPVQRAALDTAAAMVPNINFKFTYRRPRAFVALSEGNPRQAHAELAQQLKDAEAINARNEQQAIHIWMAYLSGATRDSAAVEQHLAALKAMDLPPGTLNDTEIIVYSLVGNGRGARNALENQMRLNAAQASAPVTAAQIQAMHRYTGLTLLAENKPAEALAELRMGGDNPYTTLGIIEAYKAQKKFKEADAERAAFFQRRQFSWNSSATPIMRYRARK